MIFGVLDRRRRGDRRLIRRATRRTEEFGRGGGLLVGREIGLRAWGARSSSFEDRQERSAIVFQGEIYNDLELRRELEASGCRFRSNLESELVLRAYGRWGAGCQERLHGAWAFAVWDGQEKELFCSRDRFGELPFYYSANRSFFVFGSRIRALFACPSITTKPNDRAIFDYLMGRTDRSEETFFRDVRKLESGSCLLVSPGKAPAIKRYYSPRYNPRLGRFDRNALKRHTAEFRRLLESSIKARLRPPLPGCMLSGGIDSSTIAYRAGRLSRKEAAENRAPAGKIKTFSITYKKEAEHIREIAGILDLAHCHIPPEDIGKTSWKDLMAETLGSDQPLEDPSFLGERAILKVAARKNVRVLLGGRGADELLAGHRPFRAYLNQIIRSGNPRGFIKEFEAIYPGRLEELGAAGKLTPAFCRKILGMMFCTSRPPSPLLQETLNRGFFREHGRRDLREAPPESNVQKVLWRDTLGLGSEYHPPDSQWGRQPFLDHRLVEFDLSLPACYKIHKGWTKYLLRQTMKDILPEEVCWGKMKLPTPVDPWKDVLRRNSAKLKAVLTGRRFHSAAYLDQKAVARNLDALLEDAVSPDTDDASILWRFVNLELWLRGNMRLELRRNRRS